MSAAELRFGPFRLLGRQGPLLRGEDEIHLQPKAVAVLWTLAGQPGQVVTKQALVDAVWPNTPISDEALTFQIQTLRQALGDDARAPRYLATVHRVGFRFVPPPAKTATTDTSFVGREAELQQLRETFAGAAAGQRQVVFITGEAGIGKTALCENFLARLAEGDAAISIGRGQCMEFHGAGEPFLPVLEALGSLLRGANSEKLLDLMQRAAPSWLLQMPALCTPAEQLALQQRTAGATRDRMLRELVDALDLMSADRPLVLVLEDLHWSDSSTLDVLGMLARRSTKARLLVLCTYRPVDAIVSDHPVKTVKQRLTARAQAVEIGLGYLGIAEIERYLAARLGSRKLPPTLPATVLRRTEGHPLFLVQLTNYLARRGAPALEDAQVDAEVPQGLQDVVELQIAQLSAEEQRLLETASLAGNEFSATAVAAGADTGVDAVTRCFSQLAQRGHFVEERGLAIMPNGDVSGRYGFRHAIYESVLVKRVPIAARAKLHGRIATCLEAGYGGREHEVAAELAEHFDQAGMMEKSVQLRILAARKAQARIAQEEVMLHVKRGLASLENIPAGAMHNRFELALRLCATSSTQVIGGYGTDEVRINLDRIRTLQASEPDPTLREQALALLWLASYFQSQHEQAIAYAQETRKLGESSQSALLQCSGLAWSSLGMHVMGHHVEADEQSERAVQLARTGESLLWAFTSAEPGCAAMTASAVTRWIRGFPDQALQRANEGCERAQRLGNPYMLCATRGMALPTVLLYRREFAALQQVCMSALALCQECGHLEGLAWSTKFLGIALCTLGHVKEGLPQLRQMIAAQRAAGSVVTLPVDLAHEAEICLMNGDYKGAGAALDVAFEIVQNKAERAWEPELWRIKGRLLASNQGPLNQAEDHMQRALTTARERQARSLELRAACEIASLRKTQNRQAETEALVAPIYEAFTEGFDTPDLVAARGFLN